MFFDLDRIRTNIHEAATEDLLDRATIWRADMEEGALSLIEEELRRRGVSPSDVTAHEEARRKCVIFDTKGRPAQCCKCVRPAVEEAVGWHRMWGWIPLFKRHFYYCDQHRTTISASVEA
jgi:hypothetical protein